MGARYEHAHFAILTWTAESNGQDLWIGFALEQFLGGTAGLLAATVSRLTRRWSDDHAAFPNRDLSDRYFVYVRADGVHLSASFSGRPGGTTG